MVITVYTVTDKNVTWEFYSEEDLNKFLADNPGYTNSVTTSQKDVLTEPVVSVPQSVPLWCLRTVLRASNLLQPVKDTIAAMPDSAEKIAAEEGLEYANTVLRHSPTTLFIQSVLQLTDEQVDEIFINADKIEA